MPATHGEDQVAALLSGKSDALDIICMNEVNAYQIMKQRETYATVVDELQDLKNWLHHCYKAEADAEIHKAEQCRGDIRKMSRPRVSMDLHPGNEDLYITLEKKETRPKLQPADSEFEGGNSLACQ